MVLAIEGATALHASLYYPSLTLNSLFKMKQCIRIYINNSMLLRATGRLIFTQSVPIVIVAVDN